MKKQRAYTLIEVLIVIAILGIISLFFFYFIKIINQTTKISLQKTEKSIIINTTVNSLREDIFEAEEIEFQNGSLFIENTERITYKIEDGILKRNQNDLTNNEILIMESINCKKENNLLTIQLRYIEKNREGNIFIKVIPRNDIKRLK